MSNYSLLSDSLEKGQPTQAAFHVLHDEILNLIVNSCPQGKQMKHPRVGLPKETCSNELAVSIRGIRTSEATARHP